jgi:hypothetical protein
MINGTAFASNCSVILNSTCTNCLAYTDTLWCSTSKQCLHYLTVSGEDDCRLICHGSMVYDKDHCSERNSVFTLVAAFVLLVVCPLCAVAACVYMVASKFFGSSKVQNSDEPVIVQAAPMPVNVSINQIMPMNSNYNILNNSNNDSEQPIVLGNEFIHRITDEEEGNHPGGGDPSTNMASSVRLVGGQPLYAGVAVVGDDHMYPSSHDHRIPTVAAEALIID